MFRKSFVTYIIFSLLVLFTTTCFAAEKQPKRIAILPVINQTGNVQPEIESYIKAELEDKLHIPLNAILNIYEYIPQEEILKVLPELSDKKFKTFDSSRLKTVADELSADLVVGICITSLYERQYPHLEDTLLDSNVTLHLIGYDKRKNELLNIKSQKSYTDDYSLAGTLPALTREALTKLLNKVDFKKDVFPITPTKNLHE